MYVETDFLLALVKDDDWLGEPAQRIYDERREELWTSEFALIELLLGAHREDRNAERVVANAVELLEVRDGGESVLAAATYVSDRQMTPFDALHLVKSDGDTIASSDGAYDEFTDRLDLRPDGTD